MAAEAGLHFDRHSCRDSIRHASATLPVCGKPDCNGSRLCHPRPELVRFLGARITYARRTETEGKPDQVRLNRLNLRYVERNYEDPDGWVVSSVEQREDPTATFPNLQFQEMNKPSSVGARTVSKESLCKY